MKRFTRQEFNRRVMANADNLIITENKTSSLGPATIKRKGSKVGVIAWLDGPTRSDVRLDLAKAMTWREAANFLGI